MPLQLQTMTVDEFWKLGLLQEVNRQMLHPLGIALSVIVDDETGEATGFGQLWDYRDDPEGLRLSDDEAASEDTREKVLRVQEMQLAAIPKRTKTLGFYVQPIREAP